MAIDVLSIVWTSWIICVYVWLVCQCLLTHHDTDHCPLCVCMHAQLYCVWLHRDGKSPGHCIKRIKSYLVNPFVVSENDSFEDMRSDTGQCTIVSCLTWYYPVQSACPYSYCYSFDTKKKINQSSSHLCILSCLSFFLMDTTTGHWSFVGLIGNDCVTMDTHYH